MSGIQPTEVESSGSDSLTSTSTTTTTTSEEYQRMYAAQVNAYQMQQACDHSESEFDYTTDMEMSGMSNSQLAIDNQYNSGRRSVQECADSLSAPLNMYKLIDMVREVTPSPIPQQSQSSKHVVFLEEPQIQEAPSSSVISEDADVEQEESCVTSQTNTDVRQLIEQFEGMEEVQDENKEEQEKDELIIEARSQILESQRFFQPTPPIVFEIAPVRHIPPTKIPNPTPKEWINPMVRALTTAPEVPFHMNDCLYPKPCENDFMSEQQNKDRLSFAEARKDSVTLSKERHRKSSANERRDSAMSSTERQRQSFADERKDSVMSSTERYRQSLADERKDSVMSSTLRQRQSLADERKDSVMSSIERHRQSVAEELKDSFMSSTGKQRQSLQDERNDSVMSSIGRQRQSLQDERKDSVMSSTLRQRQSLADERKDSVLSSIERHRQSVAEELKDSFMSSTEKHRQSFADERKDSVMSSTETHRQSLTGVCETFTKPLNQRKPSMKSIEEESSRFLKESPASGTRLTKAMTTASEYTVRFAPPPSEMIPLPEEEEPYMPAPIDMKPYMREDYRPKSPFVSALTTAPEKPFEGQFDRDVPIHGLDLPTPKAHLSMSDALCVASDREYTPLNPENATHRIEEEEKRKEQKKYEFQVLDHEEELGLEPPVEPVEYYTTEKTSYKDRNQRKSSAFAAMQAFQPSREPLPTNTPRNSIMSMSKDETDLEYSKYCKAVERNQKRLSYFQKKEEELNQQIQSNTSHINPTDTNNSHRSSVSSSCKKNSSASYNSSFQDNTNNTSQTPRSSFSASIAACHNKIDASDIIEETAEELEHSPILYPPPSPLSHLKGRTASSGLHRPESIPKYQRNWTVLPTQSPSRTPEPQELRDNIPLAFVDAHKTSTAVTSDNEVHKPVAKYHTTQSVASSCSTSSSNATKTTQRCSIEPKPQPPTINVTPTVPIIISKEQTGPVNMAFQSLDEYVPKDESQTPSRPYTPCSMTNKPAPIIPFYQTPEKLCFDECAAAHERPYDYRSASPFPDRAHSPAPGPPPNPLAAIRAPRIKENELSPHSPRAIQTGSISTGQSYLGAQQQQLVQEQQVQGKVLSHLETTSQAQAQSLTQIPETIETRQIGDMTVERRSREAHLEEQKKFQTQSQTKTQIGNTQIERRRKVTEEFEHSQTAKTIEVRTGSQSSSTNRRESYGKTGFVANQARRLSNLEQEISNLTSQSQAISARAAEMSDGTFPQLRSPDPTSKFPTKPVFPPHDEPMAQNYMLYANPNNKLVNPPPGFQGQEQQQRNCLPNVYGTSLVSSVSSVQQKQQHQKSLSAFASTSKTSTNNSNATFQSSQSNVVSSDLTQAYNATSTNSKQACLTNTQLCANTTASATSSGICPVTGTFCRPGHTCCKQQTLGQTHNVTSNVSLSNDSNKYRTTASTGIKPTQASTTFASNTAATPPVTATAINLSDQTNIDGSAAGGSGGKVGAAFGATSAPKRGRGTFNKAVGPGARVPLCNSCQTQIR